MLRSGDFEEDAPGRRVVELSESRSEIYAAWNPRSHHAVTSAQTSLAYHAPLPLHFSFQVLSSATVELPVPPL